MIKCQIIALGTWSQQPQKGGKVPLAIFFSILKAKNDAPPPSSNPTPLDHISTKGAPPNPLLPRLPGDLPKMFSVRLLDRRQLHFPLLSSFQHSDVRAAYCYECFHCIICCNS